MVGHPSSTYAMRQTISLRRTSSISSTPRFPIMTPPRSQFSTSGGRSSSARELSPDLFDHVVDEPVDCGLGNAVPDDGIERLADAAQGRTIRALELDASLGEGHWRHCQVGGHRREEARPLRRLPSEADVRDRRNPGDARVFGPVADFDLHVDAHVDAVRLDVEASDKASRPLARAGRRPLQHLVGARPHEAPDRLVGAVDISVELQSVLAHGYPTKQFECQHRDGSPATPRTASGALALLDRSGGAAWAMQALRLAASFAHRGSRRPGGDVGRGGLRIGTNVARSLHDDRIPSATAGPLGSRGSLWRTP